MHLAPPYLFLGQILLRMCSACFFTDELWDLLVVETNHFAAMKWQNITSPSGRPWHDVTIEEMKAFIGMLMLMGICKLPRLYMYWTTKTPSFVLEYLTSFPATGLSRSIVTYI